MPPRRARSLWRARKLPKKQPKRNKLNKTQERKYKKREQSSRHSLISLIHLNFPVLLADFITCLDLSNHDPEIVCACYCCCCCCSIIALFGTESRMND